MTTTKSTTSIRQIVHTEGEGDLHLRQATKASRDSLIEATSMGTPKTTKSHTKGVCL